MATMERLTLPAEGLSYGGGGALTVERALAGVPGVHRVSVNPLTEMAYVEYDLTRTDVARLAAAVERAGFRAGKATERRRLGKRAAWPKGRAGLRAMPNDDAGKPRRTCSTRKRLRTASARSRRG